MQRRGLSSLHFLCLFLFTAFLSVPDSSRTEVGGIVLVVFPVGVSVPAEQVDLQLVVVRSKKRAQNESRNKADQHTNYADTVILEKFFYLHKNSLL